MAAAASMNGAGQFNYDASEEPEYKAEAIARAPVGRHRPNRFGLHDVQGNVREWCRDLYGKYDLAVQAGDGLRQAPGPERSLRGVDHLDHPVKARSSMRGRALPDYRQGSIGVRPARRLF